jgi:hypothetical protein
MKRKRLSENEQSICFFLRNFGVGTHIIKPATDLDMFEFYEVTDFIENTLPILKLFGFMELKSVKLDPSGYSDDLFFKTLCGFLEQGQIQKAKELIQLTGLHVFDIFLQKEIDIPKLVNFQITGHDFTVYRDVADCLLFELEIKQPFVDFVEQEILPNVETEDMKVGFQLPEFNGEKSILTIHSKPCHIRKYSKQYELLKVIFSDTKKDWQYSEIAELIDPADRIVWKTLHSQIMAISRKIAIDTQIKDFFITTTQSVRINPTFLEPPKKSEFDLDF